MTIFPNLKPLQRCEDWTFKSLYTNGISYPARNDEATINAQRELAKDHAARLIANIKAVAA